jgi:hypothetical protein
MEAAQGTSGGAGGPVAEHGAPENSNLVSNLGKSSPAAPNYVRLGEVWTPVACCGLLYLVPLNTASSSRFGFKGFILA